MREDHGGEWCPRDHGISGTERWLDGQKELEYAPVGVSLVQHQIKSGGQ